MLWTRWLNNIYYNLLPAKSFDFFFKHLSVSLQVIELLFLTGRVIMITKEAHLPYDRPILSKVSVMLMLFAFGKSS